MRGFTKIVVAALATASAFVSVAPPSEAATVRRHLHCAIGASITLPGLILIGPITSTPFVITNQWSFDIPKNTTYTLSVGHHSWTVKNSQVLGAGQSFAVNTNYTDGTCVVSVPG